MRDIARHLGRSPSTISRELRRNATTPLRDTFTDPDGDTVNGTFQVYDAATNTPITTPAGEGLIVSAYVASGEPASVTVPAGQLKDGKTYKFRTNAYDGTHYNLSWSPWTQFVVDTTAPGPRRRLPRPNTPRAHGRRTRAPAVSTSRLRPVTMSEASRAAPTVAPGLRRSPPSPVRPPRWRARRTSGA
ncbi:hypothetical protein GCM10018966_093270 [Streptomyces yanii]